MVLGRVVGARFDVKKFDPVATLAVHVATVGEGGDSFLITLTRSVVAKAGMVLGCTDRTA